MSPLPSGGLEVPLSLTFSCRGACKEKWVIGTIEEFVENFYNFEYSGHLQSTDDTKDNDDEEDNDYQNDALEAENMDEEIDEPELLDLESDKNLDIHIVIDVM